MSTGMGACVTPLGYASPEEPRMLIAYLTLGVVSAASAGTSSDCQYLFSVTGTKVEHCAKTLDFRSTAQAMALAVGPYDYQIVPGPGRLQEATFLFSSRGITIREHKHQVRPAYTTLSWTFRDNASLLGQMRFVGVLRVLGVEISSSSLLVDLVAAFQARGITLLRSATVESLYYVPLPANCMVLVRDMEASVGGDVSAVVLAPLQDEYPCSPGLY
jgi:hypothetical protein